MKTFIIVLMTIWIAPSYALDCFYFNNLDNKSDKIRVHIPESSLIPSWSYDKKNSVKILVQENKDFTLSMSIYRGSAMTDIKLPLDTPFTLTGDKNDGVVCK
ncbi:MAG: hypothetical protein ACOYL6_14340 [Bacteriovoracaceae bacterium]